MQFNELGAAAQRCWRRVMVVAWALVLVACTDSSGKPVSAQSLPAEPIYVAAAKGKIDIEGGVVRLAARRDGVIEKVLVDEGARVKAGDVLATLDTVLAQRNLQLSRSEQVHADRQIEPARIRRSTAQREIARLEDLAQSNLVARQGLDRLKDELALANAEVQALIANAEVAAKRIAVAEREIEERIVRAPANGQIIQRQARPGNGVSTLNVTPLFLFAPDTPKIVRAELEERFVKLVVPGQSGWVVLQADQHQQFAATVLRIGKVVGQRTPSDDPAERQDHRVVECVLSIDAPELLIGQRVVVKFAAQR